MWSMINNLQLVVHTSLIKVSFPANAFMIFEYMIPVATFDFLETDDFYPKIFSTLPERDPFNTQFTRLKYDSMYMIINMGTLLMFFIWQILLYVTYPIFYHVRKCNRVTKWIR